MTQLSGPYEALFSQLAGREVIEIGLGRGDTTRLLLAAGVERVVGFEPDRSLYTEIWDDPQVEVYDFDFRLFENARITFESDPALVSDPPAHLIPDVVAFIEHQAIEDVLLTLPADRIPFGFEVVFTLPDSRVVVRLGFKRR